ncbi:coiled-coil domain-containing protein 160 [Elgaria multicarinata webbii]|uniref:coiled-coil domain-containing protein 160 n=1 Tax=Elgaria multicarinata webbii TaxID=159646 RepID=UPI002FCD24FA
MFKASSSFVSGRNTVRIYKSDQAKEAFAMESSDHHWLERLFPPHFSEEDFFRGAHQPEPLICEKLALERARRTAELYNMATAKLQADQWLQRKGSPSKLIINEHEPSLAGTKIKSKEETERDSACCRSTNLDAASEEGMVKTKGHCIWNAKEFAALRQQMKKEHSGNLALKLQLSFLKAELVELKAKCKKLVTEFEQAQEELSHSRKERLCQAAQSEQIQRQCFEKDSKIEAFQRDLCEKSGSIRSLKKELQQAREEILRFDLQKKDLQQELEKLKEQRDFENKLATGKVKLHYDMKVRKIQKELEEAKRELSIEKALNTKNTKALEMLKKHFSGQPSSDVVQNLRLYFL